MLSFEEKQELLTSFPNIKLCYDSMKHNKVDYKNENKNTFDMCLAIPCGKKCFAWFTHIQNKNICLILELSNNKNINDVKIVNCVFNNDLVYGEHGSIFYGTLFQYAHYKNDKKYIESFFTIENIFYWKGENVNTFNWFKKFNLLMNIFKSDIKQISYNKNFVVFGLPLVARNLTELKALINDVNYKIYNIYLHSFNDVNTVTTISYYDLDVNIVKYDKTINKQQVNPIVEPQLLSQRQTQTQPPRTNTNTNKPIKSNKEIVFNIKPDIQNDIYNLYCLENQKEIFYNVAYIPDYKTSVMMNKQFRNIKENDNLDLLEESDDEEEFQNENVDRFVDMSKSFFFVCRYNYKFKKWFPIKLFDTTNCKLKTEDIVVKKEDLLNSEKYYQNNKSKNYNNSKTKY
jgi:hypothetical protein